MGVFPPDQGECRPRWGPGEIGFLNASIKQVRDARVGDTITEEKRPTAAMLPGFKPAIPVVFCAGSSRLMPMIFEDLRDAVERLRSMMRRSASRWKPARRSASASAAASWGYCIWR